MIFLFIYIEYLNAVIRLLTYSGEGKACIFSGTPGLLTVTLAGTIGGIYLEYNKILININKTILNMLDEIFVIWPCIGKSIQEGLISVVLKAERNIQW